MTATSAALAGLGNEVTSRSRRLLQISPRWAHGAVESLNHIALDATRLLFAIGRGEKVYRKYVGQTKEQQLAEASILWNTSFVVDYCYRSRLLATYFAADLAASRDALFEEPLGRTAATGSIGRLVATPRSFPHIVSLRLRAAALDAQEELIASVASEYSPRSVGFHEAEYVTLQLISTLVHHLPQLRGTALSDAATYLAQAFASIDLVLGQNENLFCNEQFNDKYNVLLLLIVDRLLERLTKAPVNDALNAAGVNSVFLRRMQRAILPRILGRDEKRDYLTAVTEETEYLLYLLEYVAGYAVRSDSAIVWQLLTNLVNELHERYLPGEGLLASRTFKMAFNFHLPLAVLAYERLLESAS